MVAVSSLGGMHRWAPWAPDSGPCLVHLGQQRLPSVDLRGELEAQVWPSHMARGKVPSVP